MIDVAIATKLRATAAVTDLVGAGTSARIWPVTLLEDRSPTWPAITYQLVSGRPEYDLVGPAGVAEARIQVDCWSARRAGVNAFGEVRALAEAVRVALSGFKGTVGGVEIQSCFLDNRQVLDDLEAETFRESLDFLVSYTEA